MAAMVYDYLTSLDLNWEVGAQETNPAGLIILTGAMASSGAGNASMKWVGVPAIPIDHYVTVVYRNMNVSGTVGVGMGPICRYSRAGTGPFYYMAVAGSAGYKVFRRSNATTITSVSTAATPTFLVGDTLTLQISGVNPSIAWLVRKNGLAFASGTDNPGNTNYDGVNSTVGIGYFATDTNYDIDTFEAGNIGQGYTMFGQACL